MIERLVIVAIGALIALAAYAAWRFQQQRQLRALQVITAPVHLPATVTGGKPAELYRAGSRWSQGGPIRLPQQAERRKRKR